MLDAYTGNLVVHLRGIGCPSSGGLIGTHGVLLDVNILQCRGKLGIAGRQFPLSGTHVLSRRGTGEKDSLNGRRSAGLSKGIDTDVVEGIAEDNLLDIGRVAFHGIVSPQTHFVLLAISIVLYLGRNQISIYITLDINHHYGFL